MKPYTYLIRWTKLNISYYGVRYAQDCDPSDLWNPYKTSSQHVAKFIAEHGEPDVVQVRKTFIDTMPARLWESKVQRRMKVVKSKNWLNEHDQMAPPPQKGDLHWARKDPVKAKSKLGGENHYSKKDGYVCKILGTNNPTTRPEVKEKLKQSKLALGDNHPMKRPEERARVSATSKENWTEDRKAEQADRMRLRWQHTRFRKIECPHCKEMIGANNYKRYHGDNCKSNLARLVANTDLDVYNN